MNQAQTIYNHLLDILDVTDSQVRSASRTRQLTFTRAIITAILIDEDIGTDRIETLLNRGRHAILHYDSMRHEIQDSLPLVKLELYRRMDDV